MPPRVLLADDHVIVRQGLRALLERHGYEVVAEASDGRTAVELTSKLKPQVAILDIIMPALNGIAAAHELARVCPEVGVILLTMHGADHYVLEALRDGVRGFVIKTQAAEDLFRTIEEVVRGGVYLSPGVSHTVVAALKAASGTQGLHLSGREQEALRLVAEGKTTKQIAAIMKISVRTADFYRTRIMKKLDVHETASLVRYAIRTGLVLP